MGAGLMVLEFHCHRDSPSIKELVSDIKTPKSIESIPHDLPNLQLIDESLLRFSSAWGRPYGFAQEQSGAIIQNLFPIKQNEIGQISSSSKAALEMHTETAFHPWKPQHIVLLCLRGDDRAGTTYATLDDILDHLDRETIDVLHEPLFTTTLDKSFQNEYQEDATITTPILLNNASSMVYDRVLMKAKTQQANTALNKFSEAIETSKQVFKLNTGQAAIIENWKVVHGRTPFTPRYDGTDRWIKRVMVRSSTPPARDIDVAKEDGTYIVKTKF
jgi:alpha-ketoglutarate-dependent taurine dioxygenase